MSKVGRIPGCLVWTEADKQAELIKELEKKAEKIEDSQKEIEKTRK